MSPDCNVSDVPGRNQRVPDSAPKHIGIMGTPISSGNRGVIALAESLVRLCLEAAPGASILLLGSDRSGGPVTMHPGGAPIQVAQVRWRLSPSGGLHDHLAWIAFMALLYRCVPVASVRRWIARRTPWIRALESTALVGDIRGGDSFSDIYGLKRFLLATVPVWTVVAVKGTIVQFPQTFGPFRSRTARRVARFLLLRSSVVIARDERSRAVARELTGGRKDIALSPDVAFALLARPPSSLETDPPVHGGLPAGTIGVNVSGLLFNGGYDRQNQFGLALDYAAVVPRLVEALLAAHPGEILLVPHTYAPPGNVESDNDACRRVRDALSPDLRRRVRMVTAEYDPQEVKAVIGLCDFFIGSRMHSCIAALSQGIPCVGVAYSTKFAGVFGSVGMDRWVVDATTTPADAAIERIVELFEERDAIRGPLQAHASRARADLAEVFSKLVQAQASP